MIDEGTQAAVVIMNKLGKWEDGKGVSSYVEMENKEKMKKKTKRGRTWVGFRQVPGFDKY